MLEKFQVPEQSACDAVPGCSRLLCRDVKLGGESAGLCPDGAYCPVADPMGCLGGLHAADRTPRLDVQLLNAQNHPPPAYLVS